MTPEDQATIGALQELLGHGYRDRVAPDAFWDEFDKIAGDIGQRAFADDAEADLVEQYCDILANADDSEYSGPNGPKD